MWWPWHVSVVTLAPGCACRAGGPDHGRAVGVKGVPARAGRAPRLMAGSRAQRPRAAPSVGSDAWDSGKMERPGARRVTRGSRQGTWGRS